MQRCHHSIPLALLVIGILKPRRALFRHEDAASQCLHQLGLLGLRGAGQRLDDALRQCVLAGVIGVRVLIFDLHIIEVADLDMYGPEHVLFNGNAACWPLILRRGWLGLLG
jgi:hypothetical protein